MFGIVMSARRVSRFLPETPPKPASQTWRTSQDQPLGSLASIDFLTAPTATFFVLFLFFLLVHNRRRVVHCSVTERPSSPWTAR
jgi:putative transposase